MENGLFIFYYVSVIFPKLAWLEKCFIEINLMQAFYYNFETINTITFILNLIRYKEII